MLEIDMEMKDFEKMILLQSSRRKAKISVNRTQSNSSNGQCDADYLDETERNNLSTGGDKNDHNNLLSGVHSQKPKSVQAIEDF